MDHQTQITLSGSKKACVTDGTGYLASILIKHLLQNNYKVNTTVTKHGVKDLENEKKMTHLRKLQEIGDLTIFEADLEVEGSLDTAFSGCDYIFYVATSTYFQSNETLNDILPSVVQTVTNVLKSCLNSKSVKRVFYTSSADTVSCNNLSGPELVMNEDNWTDTEFLEKEKPFSGHSMTTAKVLAEKAALEFSKKNNIDLITVIPAVVDGPYSDYPYSLGPGMSLITGNFCVFLTIIYLLASELYMIDLKEVQERIVYVQKIKFII